MELILKNHLKEVRTEQKLSQAKLAQMVGVSPRIPGPRSRKRRLRQTCRIPMLP